MRKRRKRRRSIRRGGLAARVEQTDLALKWIKGSEESLDRLLGEPFPAHLSEYEAAWAEGCREGMAIAYDLMMDRVSDIAIRGAFKPHPIKMRYHSGAEMSIKDDSLINNAPKGRFGL